MIRACSFPETSIVHAPHARTGFYFFNTLGDENRSTYVGSHIRPRMMAPAEWKWPVGVSLIAGGFEYYGSIGPLNNIPPYQSQ